MVVIKDDRDERKVLLNRREEPHIHVHGNGLKVGCFSFHYLEEWFNISPRFSFNGMQNTTGLKVDKDAHVRMPLADTELVNAKILQILHGGRLVFSLQVFFVDIFNQIPANA